MGIKKGKGYELNRGHCFITLFPGQGNKPPFLTTKLGSLHVTQKGINSARLDRQVSDFSSSTKPVVINALG